MLTEDDFDPKPDEKDEHAFNVSRDANVHANNKMISRRKALDPWIAKIKDAILKQFNGRLKPEQAQVALSTLYDMIHRKIEESMHKGSVDTETWLRVARDVVDIDEYALMESQFDLIDEPYNQDKSKVESLYNGLLRSGSQDASAQARIFMEIGFALVMIIEEEAEADNNTVDEFFTIKEDLDKKYGPMFTGLERQYHDAISNNRRYGRTASFN